MKDTPPEINARLFAAMMRRTPAERLLMCLDMMATGRVLSQSRDLTRAGGDSPNHPPSALEAAVLEGVHSPHEPYNASVLDRIRQNARAQA